MGLPLSLQGVSSQIHCCRPNVSPPNLYVEALTPKCNSIWSKKIIKVKLGQKGLIGFVSFQGETPGSLPACSPSAQTELVKTSKKVAACAQHPADSPPAGMCESPGRTHHGGRCPQKGQEECASAILLFYLSLLRVDQDTFAPTARA